MAPTPKDEYRTLMAKTLHNFNYLTLGFLTYDAQKVKGSAENLASLSEYLIQKMPAAYEKNVAQWESYARRMAKYAMAVNDKFSRQEYDTAMESFNRLRVACMGCHKLYRRDVITAEY